MEGRLKGTDVQIAETLVEIESEEAAAKALAQAQKAQRSSGALLTTTAYIRFGGTRAWTLSEAGSVSGDEMKDMLQPTTAAPGCRRLADAKSPRRQARPRASDPKVDLHFWDSSDAQALEERKLTGQ